MHTFYYKKHFYLNYTLIFIGLTFIIVGLFLYDPYVFRGHLYFIFKIITKATNVPVMELAKITGGLSIIIP